MNTGRIIFLAVLSAVFVALVIIDTVRKYKKFRRK